MSEDIKQDGPVQAGDTAGTSDAASGDTIGIPDAATAGISGTPDVAAADTVSVPDAPAGETAGAPDAAADDAVSIPDAAVGEIPGAPDAAAGDAVGALDAAVGEIPGATDAASGDTIGALDAAVAGMSGTPDVAAGDTAGIPDAAAGVAATAAASVVGDERRKHVVATSIMAVLIAVLAALLVWAASAAGAEDDLTDVPEKYRDLDRVVLIGADSAGKDSAGQLFGELIAHEAADITGGKLAIDYHANGSLGGDADLLRQVQYNDIQLLVCQTAPTVSFIPEMAVFDLPMAFAQNSGDEIEAVLNGQGAFRDGIEAAYNKAGLHLLGFLQNATFRLTTSNADLKTLEDFKGLQIRTMENSNHMAFWQAISAEPTPLAWSELYISLQNGTVDAEENAADSILGASFQEVQRYLACTDHILYCNQVCLNDEAWNALDPAYQEALAEAVQRAIDKMRPEMLKIDEDSKAALADGGMEIITYDNGFFDEVLALPKVRELYDAIDGATGGLGSIMTDQLDAMHSS